MPELSRFFGIIIRIRFGDHAPPHFHVEYGEYRAVLDIATLGVNVGTLPSRALGLVVEWAALHREELIRAWEQVSAHQTPDPIPPLE